VYRYRKKGKKSKEKKMQYQEQGKDFYNDRKRSFSPIEGGEERRTREGKKERE